VLSNKWTTLHWWRRRMKHNPPIQYIDFGFLLDR
jgi:hypothetical protein